MSCFVDYSLKMCLLVPEITQMKKILLLLIFTLFIAACSHFETKQQLAENFVKLYLDSTLNDPKSYENVKFSNFKLLPYAYEDTVLIGVRLKDSIEYLKKKGKLFEAKQIRHFLDSIDFIYPNPIIRAYRIDHIFRAKNSFGGLILSNKTFVISPDFKTLIAETDNN